MRRVMLVLLLIALAGPAVAAPSQITTTSWHGLSGLYVIPTARIIGRGNLAFGFNESRHTEFVNGLKDSDRQIRGVVTYGVADNFELYFSYFNNMFAVQREPNLGNQTFTTFGAKLRILPEDDHYWYPEVSIAVRDIADHTADVGPLSGVHNGTKAFLIASKRLFRNDSLGRFMDVHAGLTWDTNAVAGMAGFELTITPNVSLIAEGMWDSPFLNFRQYGQNDVQGRFIFDPGVRIYPELVPGMVLDLGFVGDSEFEFSFGISYVAGL